MRAAWSDRHNRTLRCASNAAHWIAALLVLKYAVSTAPLGIHYWEPRVHSGMATRPQAHQPLSQ